jgi:hypothetical protein
MTDVEELVETLLYEGYALYPYTPGATKNATPTPFGIVYPPVYAAPNPHTFDQAKMPCIVEAGAGAAVSLSVRFLQASGVRHEAVARRIDLSGEGTEEFDFDGVCGRVSLGIEALYAGLVRVTARVENTTEVPEGLTRTEALTRSLLSTHLVTRVEHGRFASPSAPAEHLATAVMTCQPVNTFPVLAADDDSVMLGAAIILPDHPQIAPESKGSLFDGTEIEEALRLHLLALSDGEREELKDHDPALREMLERAIASAPADLVGLHGRVTISDPADEEIRGEEQAALPSGTIVRRGDRVNLRPEVGKHAQDHLLTGRTATIERIYVDYDDLVHLCVTIDDDPGQDLMRDIGRYLYFKVDEVEAMA